MILTDGKKLLLLLTIFAIATAAIVLSNNVAPAKPFAFSVQCGQEQERITLWEDAQGNFYAFLPGYMQLDDVYFDLIAETPIMINGKPIDDNVSCADFNFDIFYELEYCTWGRQNRSQFMFVRSGGVATMFIDTMSKSMEYIHENKENKEDGSARLYKIDGTLDCRMNQLTIKGRGNATWTESEKKPYTIQLPEEVDLLEMGSANKWILLANAFDYSHLRNKIVYDFAAELGLPYAPECEWVDVYLNGVYAGIYLLAEKVEVHPERVAIDKENSFLVSIEHESRLLSQRISYISTENKESLRIHYPEHVSISQKEELKTLWQSIENAIISEDGIDSSSGKNLEDLIDIDSWVANYLIDEVFGNLDGFLVSRYFYFDSHSEPKVYAGPVWDYDRSLGNDTDSIWRLSNPNVLVLSRYKNDDYFQCAWINELYERAWFQKKIDSIFETKMIPLIETLLNSKIDNYANSISNSAKMNSLRWSLGGKVNFDYEVLQIKSYLKDHVAFLKEVWLEDTGYHQVLFSAIDSGGYDQFYMVTDNSCLQYEPIIEDQEGKTFAGWYYYETNEPFDITRPITEDVGLYAVWEDKPSKKLGRIVELLPIGLIAVIGVCLFLVDVRKIKRSG